MKQIKVLDLFCGAGGASMGYYKAAESLGFEIKITGVDIINQPNYPFKFIKMDALLYLRLYGKYFDFIHTSPPCQAYSKSTSHMRSKGKIYSDMVADTRNLLIEINKHSIIENVPQAPIRKDVVLKGTMFDLKVIRTRHFELINWFMLQHKPEKHKGTVSEKDFVCVAGNASWSHNTKDKIKGAPVWALPGTIVNTWRFEMGNYWMKTDRELALSIPYKYTEYIFTHYLKNYYE